MSDHEPDTCSPVEIDGELIRVRGAAEMSDESRAALAEVIGAAKRKFAAEHPAERLTVDTITSDALDDLHQRAELLAYATVLEIPRPEPALPVQLRRSHGYLDRWAICDGVVGRRWHREHGWVYETQGIRDEEQRDATRYTLAEAVPLAQKLAAGVQP